MKTKKWIRLAVALILIGCATKENNPMKPKSNPKEKYKLTGLSLEITEKHTPKNKYHSEKEIRETVKKQVIERLKEKNLYSEEIPFVPVRVEAEYERKFKDENTDKPSDSLAFPSYRYTVHYTDPESKTVYSTKTEFEFSGGFALNAKSKSGLLNEKSDEKQFIEALSKEIANRIEKIAEDKP